MHLVILSGLSGSGKSNALQTLEDEGFFCVDNLPLSFVISFIERFVEQNPKKKLAIVLDARGFPEDIQEAQSIFKTILNFPFKTDFVFLDSTDEILLQRYRDTRRRHPLFKKNLSLIECIHYERELLEPIRAQNELLIDTSYLSVHDLREIIKNRVLNNESQQLSIQIESFGFKHGLPLHSDFVFDARCLTNPHWETRLREQTGRDKDVIDYLDHAEDVQRYLDDLIHFFTHWNQKFEQGTRAYLTIAIGCTGGQHRSVYLVEKLAESLSSHYALVIKHRELHITYSIKRKL